MEKRAYLRVNSDFHVWYQTVYESSDFSFGKELSHDLSIGGIQLEMEDIDTPGTVLILKFDLPEYNKKIEVKGKVMWAKRLNSDKFLVGIQFVDLSSVNKDFINKYVKQNNMML